ncbi:hypothetical protein FT663_05495 [Candidozyma haemuli var. vulneris]|nr:hypothetical protein FT663_05495 [[Candida] haemuloni var. vulneris]KAF3985089.1 hypothetical protein FT662_05363 [[Candida] haemuloni var. vulneris]
MDIHKQIPGISTRWPDILADLDFDNDFIGKTTVDLLLESERALRNEAGNTLENAGRKEFAQEFIDAIRETIEDQEIKDTSFQNCTTGLKSLDDYLGGGLDKGSITEIFGTSGTGKSHLVTTSILANLSHQTDDTSTESLVICTESPLETRRLTDISGEGTDRNYLSKISYTYCPDLDSFDHIIFTQLPVLLDRAKLEGKTINLIVIDSIAHHLRGSDDFKSSQFFLKERVREQEAIITSHGCDYTDSTSRDIRNKFYKFSTSFRNRILRAHYLMSLYAELARLSRIHQVPILLTNQVSDYFASENSTPTSSQPLEFYQQVGPFSGWSFGLQQSAGQIPSLIHNPIVSHNSTVYQDEDSPSVASLGTLWSRLVTCRVRLSKCRDVSCTNGEISNKSSVARPLSLNVASNYGILRPPAFHIAKCGLVWDSAAQ